MITLLRKAERRFKLGLMDQGYQFQASSQSTTGLSLLLFQYHLRGEEWRAPSEVHSFPHVTQIHSLSCFVSGLLYSP